MTAARYMPGLLFGVCVAVCAHGAPVPQAGRALLIRTDLDPLRSEARIRLDPSMDPGVSATTSILLFDPKNGDAACWTLPASGWRRHVQGLVYNDPRLAASPVRRAEWRRGHLTLALSGLNTTRPIGYPVRMAALSAVAIVLTNATAAGEFQDCFEFDAATATIVVDRPGPDAVFRAYRAVAPAACPTAPIACPPGPTPGS